LSDGHDETREIAVAFEDSTDQHQAVAALRDPRSSTPTSGNWRSA